MKKSTKRVVKGWAVFDRSEKDFCVYTNRDEAMSMAEPVSFMGSFYHSSEKLKVVPCKIEITLK